jgi:hypothetical protein
LGRWFWNSSPLRMNSQAPHLKLAEVGLTPYQPALSRFGHFPGAGFNLGRQMRISPPSGSSRHRPLTRRSQPGKIDHLSLRFSPRSSALVGVPILLTLLACPLFVYSCINSLTAPPTGFKPVWALPRLRFQPVPSNAHISSLWIITPSPPY